MPSRHDQTNDVKDFVKHSGSLAGALVLMSTAFAVSSYGRFFNENVQAIFNWAAIFVFCTGAILAIMDLSLRAKSLGYSAAVSTNKETSMSAGRDINIIPAPTQALAENYDGANVLSPLENARFRILDHIAKLRNNSVFNLYIGLGIASIGIVILFSAILQIGQFVDKEKHIFDTNSFVFFALIPKLSVTVFIQIFSYFFLAMYRSNQNDISIFKMR